VQALTALRRRFPGSTEAATAAFMLGRMAQDQGKAPAAAAAWFTRYLNEEPGGEHAPEALGRLLQTIDEAGDEADARRIATRYLTLFPGGPYAEHARSVMARARAADAGASPPRAP